MRRRHLLSLPLWLGALWAMAWMGCASIETVAPPRARPVGVEGLGQGCTPQTVVSLCTQDGCRFYWCSALAPVVAGPRQPQAPDSPRMDWPDAIGTRPPEPHERLIRDAVFARGRGGTVVLASAPVATRAVREKAKPDVERGDVIQQLLLLESPGDVAQWWSSGPRMEPQRWSHPLSEWETRYIAVMSANGVPEALRMPPPVSAEGLTLQEAQEAERLFGSGLFAAQDFTHWENRRRILCHYLHTHPGTLHLVLDAHGLGQEENPLFSAFEKGWEAANGKQFLTGEDAARLGEAAEFFSALAVGVAQGKLTKSTRPASVPSSVPLHFSPQVEAEVSQHLANVTLPMSPALPQAGTGSLPPRSCGGHPVPEGWPDLPESQVVESFLSCTSPAEFVELQRGVDMARLVEALRPWDAVRLGAQGPLREGADVLNRKRAEFIAYATEWYSLPRAEVFTLYLIHSSFTDDVQDVLKYLAEEKQLELTVLQMHQVLRVLQQRGIDISSFKDRPERPSDVLRGLAHFGTQASLTIPLVSNGRGMQYHAEVSKLPAPYRDVVDQIDMLMLFGNPEKPEEIFLRGVDSFTYGVPSGFYNLVFGTLHGLGQLWEGHFELATRELAAAAVVGVLYAHGKLARAFASGEGAAAGASMGIGLRSKLWLDSLSSLGQRLVQRLGTSGIIQLAQYLQASREAALFVLDGGEEGAFALAEARGDVGRARVWMNQAAKERPPRTTSLAARATPAAEAEAGSFAALVDEATGYTPEVVEAKFALEESSVSDGRLPSNLKAVEKAKPVLERPPEGVSPLRLRWREYVAYYEKRHAEMVQAESSGTLDSVKPPLKWTEYESLRDTYARGIRYQQARVTALLSDAIRLRGFRKPRIQQNSGVFKADLRYADALVIETDVRPGEVPRVETFSFKSRNFTAMNAKAVKAQLEAYALEAQKYYGGELDIRTPGLGMRGQPIRVAKVHLVCDAEFLPASAMIEDLTKLLAEVSSETGVEIRFE